MASPVDNGTPTPADQAIMGPAAGSAPRHVEVVPLGRVDQVALSVIAANLQMFTGLLADVTAPWPKPDYALLPARRQYNALPILKALAADIQDRVLRLGVITEDLCLPILSYVFGEAHVNGVCAVVSLFRLRWKQEGKPAAADLMFERLAKVAVHEISHVLGLRHCQVPWCLMAFSLGLEQIDSLSLRFCPSCERFIRRRVFGPHP
ncbi:MAG: matrixin family metalloprotease [Thermodesulfobacteriota bacterium]